MGAIDNGQFDYSIFNDAAVDYSINDDLDVLFDVLLWPENPSTMSPGLDDASEGLDASCLRG